MNKIGKKQRFIGQFQLFQTANLGKYILERTLPSFVKASKKSIIVSLDEDGIWVKENMFQIGSGDIFKLI